MDYEILGKILKSARIVNNLTQSEIASKFKVTFQNISSWERGKSKIDIDTLLKLCDFYGIDFADVLRKANGLYKTSKKFPVPVVAETGKQDIVKEQLLNNYVTLNAEGREKLCGYSDDLVSSGKYTKNDQS